MQPTRTVGIIGGGIGGLASAYYLSQRVTRAQIPPVRVLLFERSSRFGGWIHSKQLGSKYHSHLFELGPRTLRLQSGIGSLSEFTAVNTLKLLEQLNLLEDQFHPIEKSSPANKNRLIYSKEQLINLNDLSLIFGGKPLRYPPIVYVLYEYFSKKGRFAVKDETIKSFIHRRFGSVLAEEIVEYLLDPVMKGVYAGDVSQLSARSVLKKFFELEQRYGSIVNGLIKSRKNKSDEQSKHFLFDDLNFKEYENLFDQHAIYYFRDGMEVLVQRLMQSLASNPNIEFHRNQSIERIEFFTNEQKPVELTTKSGEKYLIDHLISAVPAPDLGNLVDSQRYSALKSRLNQIHFVSMVVINLLYEKENIYPKEAFGYLIPSREHSHILGVLFDSCVREKVDRSKRGSQLTVMMGGVWFDQLHLGELTDEQLMKIVRTELKQQIQLEDKPVHYSISRLHRAIPNYNVGHQDVLDHIDALIRRDRLPLTLVGNSYRGVGVSDVIYDARVEIERLTFDSTKTNHRSI